MKTVLKNVAKPIEHENSCTYFWKYIRTKGFALNEGRMVSCNEQRNVKTFSTENCSKVAALWTIHQRLQVYRQSPLYETKGALLSDVSFISHISCCRLENNFPQVSLCFYVLKYFYMPLARNDMVATEKAGNERSQTEKKKNKVSCSCRIVRIDGSPWRSWSSPLHPPSLTIYFLHLKDDILKSTSSSVL